MIEIKLPEPMLVESQAADIENEYCENYFYAHPDKDNIDTEPSEIFHKLMTCMELIHVKSDDTWEFAQIADLDTPKDISALDSDGNEGYYLHGAAAVKYWCGTQRLHAPETINRVCITSKVLNACDMTEWYDICYLVKRVEYQSTRLSRLIKTGCLPVIIYTNELRMLYERLSVLENNRNPHRVHQLKLGESEYIPCSLADKDFTLINECRRQISPVERLLKRLGIRIHDFSEESEKHKHEAINREKKD